MQNHLNIMPVSKKNSRERKKSTSIRDIARLAGVSLYTASAAMNNKTDISEKTKKMVLSLAKEHNYVPNIAARSLRSRKTNNIGIIIPEWRDLFFVRIIEGINLV